jgi:hypothetical protein
MSSFLFGTEYGTDQINVGSDDIGNYINYNNPNNLNQINAIKNKESRLLKKFNQYTPTIQNNNNTRNNNTRNNNTRNNNTRNNNTRNNNTRNSDDYSVYANDGLNLDKLRYDIINDIENKYFAGNEISVKDYIQETNEKHVKNHRQNTGNNTGKSPKNNPRKDTGKNIVSEGFNIQLNDLHYELEEMEKKNNMLLVFIFFLVIIVIIQYSKNIDKLQFTAIPSQSSAANPIVPNA